MGSVTLNIISTYLILLLVLVHNIVRYLIMQRKYQQVHLSLFYGISTTSTVYKIVVNLAFYNGHIIVSR